MKNDFLENLKKALDGGDVDMTSINRLNQIYEKSNEVMGEKTIKEITESVAKKVEEGGKKIVSEEEAIKMNKEYEIQMRKSKSTDLLNNTIANTLQIEDMVLQSIEDLKYHLIDVRKYVKENIEIFDGMEEYNTLMDLIGGIEGNFNFKEDDRYVELLGKINENR